MEREWTFNEKMKLLGGSLAIVIAVFFLFRYCFVYLWPFALGAGIAVIIEKPVNMMTKRFPRAKTSVAAVIVFLIAAIVIAVIGYLTFLGVGEALTMIKKFSLNENGIGNAGFEENAMRSSYYGNQVYDICCNIDGWAGLKAGGSYEFLCNCKEQLFAFLTGKNGVLGNVVLKNSINTIKFLFVVFGSVFVSFIAAVYTCGKLEIYRSWIRSSIFSRELLAVHGDLKILINVYFKIQFIIFLINSSICIGALMLLKNPYAFVLGVFVGVLDALPVFGTGTVLVPWALVLILLKKYKAAAFLMAVYIVTYLIRQVMESKCIGERVGIAPLTMLAVIFIGLMVYGIMGFILGPISYVIMKSLITCLKEYLKPLEKVHGT